MLRPRPRTPKLKDVALLAVSLPLFGAPATGISQELHEVDLGECALESGEVILDCRITYRTLGTPHTDHSNVILFPTWYGGRSEHIVDFLDDDDMIDIEANYVIVVDAFGNGNSSSPSNSPSQPGGEFPRITIRDMVRQQHRMLTEELGIASLKGVVGISMGGMQAFEWAVAYPDFVERVVPIVGSPRLAVYDIALWELDAAFLADFIECECTEPLAERARVFMLATGPDYHARVTPREDLEKTRESWKETTMTPERAWDLTSQLHAMIAHDVGELTDGSIEQAAATVEAEMFVVVGTYDHVVTPHPALEFAEMMGAATLPLTNDCGHQAAGCEAVLANSAIRGFLERQEQPSGH
jgi:homoserine O-acetyltransferase